MPAILTAPPISALAPAIDELSAAAIACAQAARIEASRLTDTALLDQQRALAAIARQIELATGSLAAEISQRSRRELGYSGLAQRHGARTAEALVQDLTGTSTTTARRLVRVGQLVAHAHEPDLLAEPWLAPLLSAVAAGNASAETVDVVRVGLGLPSSTISMDALRIAVATLTDLVPEVSLELLAARARELRDDLDAADQSSNDIAAREHERFARRSLRLFPQIDGMTRLVGLLDPESAAVISGAIDVATSPRRGGPRFVDSAATDAAQRVLDDPRSIEQLALDALVELVDVAVRSRALDAPGARRADVRVLVTQRDLDRRAGVAFIEGQTASVSVATAERHACDGGVVPILFDDDGSALNLGRSQRLHSAKQRIAIAVRDGGCLAPDCTRAASWCEVHHINEFSRGGNTDLADGVLLCRHHHMLVHNNGWRVERRGRQYWMLPPPDLGADRTPILLATKSAAVRRMLGASG